MLLRLWREWHEGEPVQYQLPLEWAADDVEASAVKKNKKNPSAYVSIVDERCRPTAFRRK